MKFKRGHMRVWHIPQVPGKGFRYDVDSVKEAARLLDALAEYDLFQYKNNIKPDYCNAQGLEIYDPSFGDNEDDCWIEWHSTDGLDIQEYMRQGACLDSLIWEMDGEEL